MANNFQYISHDVDEETLSYLNIVIDDVSSPAYVKTAAFLSQPCYFTGVAVSESLSDSVAWSMSASGGIVH